MLEHKRVTIDKELNDLINDIDKNQNGIYAYPQGSEEEREETRRLMKEFINFLEVVHFHHLFTLQHLFSSRSKPNTDRGWVQLLAPHSPPVTHSG
jgi:hypothetical protein